MNILSYYDCLHESDYWDGCSFAAFFAGMWDWYLFSLSKEHNLKVLISEKIYYQCQSLLSNNDKLMKPYRGRTEQVLCFLNKIDFVTISEQEELSCFDYNYTLHEIYMLDFENKLDVTGYNKLKSMIYNKTNNFQPDMIISYPIHLNFLEKMYEGVPVFTSENGMFSLGSLPHSIYFDPIGSLDHNFLTRFSSDIKKYKISKSQNDSVERLKGIILAKTSMSDDKVKIINDYKSKRRKNVLLPLTFSYRLGDAYEFDKDIDVVEFVMNNVPKDIGVWVTDHPACSSISFGNYVYYKQKFPNFVYVSKLLGSDVRTPELTPYFDGIINSISQSGYWGLIFDKPVISICDHYNNLIQDGTLDDIERILDSSTSNKNNILCWYLTHYVVFEDKYQDAKWYSNYFLNKVNKYKGEGVNFSFYDEIETIDNICQLFQRYTNIPPAVKLKDKILRWICPKKKKDR